MVLKKKPNQESDDDVILPLDDYYGYAEVDDLMIEFRESVLRARGLLIDLLTNNNYDYSNLDHFIDAFLEIGDYDEFDELKTEFREWLESFEMNNEINAIFRGEDI